MLASQIKAAKEYADDYLEKFCRVTYRGTPLDVTDFGLGDFDSIGLVAYVLANTPDYCNKWLVLKAGQLIPNHFHPKKTEDIFAAAGSIEVTLYGTAPDARRPFDCRNRKVEYHLNNRRHQRRCGKNGITIVLSPGDRIRIISGTWHDFRAIGGPALAEEVSKSNDDVNDNVFEMKKIGRFVRRIKQDLRGDGIVVRIKKGFIQIKQVV